MIDLLYAKYLKAKISYEGIRRVERYPFPLSAVREAVVNAIVHKNYPAGVPIQIRVYENRLVVGNSCILPEGWSVEDLLVPHPSDPHNPKIANVFFLAGQIESWGRGVQKILSDCKLDGIGEPTFRMVDNNLSVEFEAPESRLVGAGSSRKGDVLGARRDDAGVIHDDAGANRDDSHPECDDLSQAAQPGNDRFNATTRRNIDELRNRLSGADQFGRSEVVEVIGGSDSRAGNLLKKMFDVGIVEKVKGHGKGRYRFTECQAQ